MEDLEEEEVVSTNLDSRSRVGIQTIIPSSYSGVDPNDNLVVYNNPADFQRTYSAQETCEIGGKEDSFFKKLWR